MIGPRYRLLIVAALAATMLPTAAFAQTQSGTPDPLVLRNAVNRFAASAAESPASAASGGMSRGAKTAIGFGIGAAAGLFIGEVWFGQSLDFPHGPDMLLGAGIFGAVGALIGHSFGSNAPSAPTPPKKTIGITPILTRSTKAVMVRLSLK